MTDFETYLNEYEEKLEKIYQQYQTRLLPVKLYRESVSDLQGLVEKEKALRVQIDELKTRVSDDPQIRTEAPSVEEAWEALRETNIGLQLFKIPEPPLDQALQNLNDSNSTSISTDTPSAALGPEIDLENDSQTPAAWSFSDDLSSGPDNPEEQNPFAGLWTTDDIQTFDSLGPAPTPTPFDVLSQDEDRPSSQVMEDAKSFSVSVPPGTEAEPPKQLKKKSKPFWERWLYQ